jgi:dimethylargininase
MSSMKALVRRPSPRLAEGIVTHIERRPVDVELALAQWHAYVRALQELGWDTIEVPPADDCPDGVFIEDAVVIYRDVAVICRPGDDARRPEINGVEPVVAELGCSVQRIVEPGTLDGGDVLKIGDTVYVGQGGRTNAEGLRQLQAILGALGATVVGVPLANVLHLKSAVTALPDGTIIGSRDGLADTSMFERFVQMPEDSGGHVVLVGEDRVLMAADAPVSSEQIRSLGYLPTTVDISEFIKLEGCVTCLSVRLRDLP